MIKIKITTPRKYYVRPNSDILEPYKSTEIEICLQPFLLDPVEKNKHKFMLRNVFAPEGWTETTPDQLMYSKLKYAFEIPVEQDETAYDSTKFCPKVGQQLPLVYWKLN